MGDGNEVTKYFTNTAINDSAWHHGSASERDCSEYLGRRTRKVPRDMLVDQAQRAFFADVQGMNHPAW